MTEIFLELKAEISIKEVKHLASKDFYSRTSKSTSFEQSMIYVLIHKFSNYEEIMWQLFKNEKSFVLMQLKKLLLDISKLDQSLTWDCQIILDRYKRQLKLRKKKSSFVLAFTNENGYLAI